MLFYFWETRYFAWKIENYDELQLPETLMIFIEILHTFHINQCLQRFSFQSSLQAFKRYVCI